MKGLTAEEILKAADMKAYPVEVPEWGGTVYIRVMTVGERDSHELEWLRSKERGVPNFRSKFLVKILSDAEGNRLFKDEQAPKLAEKNGDVCHRLFEIAMKKNAVTEQDVEELAGE